jgi:hypothetical protein
MLCGSSTVKEGCACYHEQASRAVDKHLEEARPQGPCREDGIIPIGGGFYVQMPMATRDHLVAWALQENDERNLAYIKSRWDSHPECKTLAELEGVTKERPGDQDQS